MNKRQQVELETRLAVKAHIYEEHLPPTEDRILAKRSWDLANMTQSRQHWDPASNAWQTNECATMRRIYRPNCPFSAAMDNLTAPPHDVAQPICDSVQINGFIYHPSWETLDKREVGRWTEVNKRQQIELERRKIVNVSFYEEHLRPAANDTLAKRHWDLINMTQSTYHWEPVSDCCRAWRIKGYATLRRIYKSR